MHAQELDTSTLNLAHSLKETLSDVVAFYFAAHRAHWNVTGEDFSQYHKLFLDIYEDTYQSVDGFAERIRILNYFPDTAIDMITQSKVQDTSTTTDALALAADLLNLNGKVLDTLSNAFIIADAAQSQGIANYIAERLDAHEKWSWQLRSCLAPQESTVDNTDLVLAESTPKTMMFSADTRIALANKAKEHNENVPSDKKVSVDMLSVVYRRGAQSAATVRATPALIASIGMDRVNSFLRLVTSHRPSNVNYKQDNDVLPVTHPLRASIAAAGSQHTDALAHAEYLRDQLVTRIAAEEEHESPEHVLFSMAEYSGLGYETMPAFRGAWLRAVTAQEDPYVRVLSLATKLYSSKDADLLPTRKYYAQ